MRIRINANELNLRKDKIRQLLLPIVDRPNNLFIKPKIENNATILSACGKGFDQSLDYTGLRFRTFSTGFLASYYERWFRNYLGKKEFFYLDRAYLHLYQVDASKKTDKEFVLLHCDPNEPDDAAHAKYKQGPHMHIECVDAPWPHGAVWPHSHISLNLGHLDNVLESADSITTAIRTAVFMLKEQVLTGLRQ